MERIESFKVNHLKLMPGLYVSRKNKYQGVTVTTFDLRMTTPNKEPVIDQPALHTIEHLGATFFHNCPLGSDVIDFGVYGCRTGCSLIMFGDLSAEDLCETVLNMCNFVLDFDGPIPGALPDQCGNFSEQNLPMAKYYIARYKQQLKDFKRFTYPE